MTSDTDRKEATALNAEPGISQWTPYCAGCADISPVTVQRCTVEPEDHKSVLPTVFVEVGLCSNCAMKHEAGDPAVVQAIAAQLVGFVRHGTFTVRYPESTGHSCGIKTASKAGPTLA